MYVVVAEPSARRHGAKEGIAIHSRLRQGGEIFRHPFLTVCVSLLREKNGRPDLRGKEARQTSIYSNKNMLRRL